MAMSSARASRRATLFVAIVFLVVAVGLIHMRADSSQYMVTDIGVLPGGDYSQAWGFNNQGTVVGTSKVGSGSEAPPQHVFFWDDGRIFAHGWFGGDTPTAY